VNGGPGRDIKSLEIKLLYLAAKENEVKKREGMFSGSYNSSYPFLIN
jgi:hypothetical protein